MAATATGRPGRLLQRFTQWAITRWQGRFYLGLAVLFTVGILADTAWSQYSARMRLGTYDRLVKARVHVPEADPDIVIVDIDEASLAGLAAEYGRWPWPRQVLGEFVEQLERQHPKAVVFDILFSDADVFNRDSDAYFDAAIAGTSNTYFPFLRLAEQNDALSQIGPRRIPGVLPIDGETQGDAGIAVVLPQFAAALAGGRLGFHNIYADPDGIVREYRMRRREQGWELSSLPLRVGRDLGWPLPAEDHVLLNWRGPPFTYRHVSFKDVFEDFLSKDRKRPQDEFSGKIVLIGSTAPALFDLKPTPVAELHPGVEILATALDNLKHADYLRSPQGELLYPLVALLILWGTAFSFHRDVGRGRIDRLFGASQFILIGVSYASINLTTTYINLTGPVTVGIGYFTLARLFAAASDRTLKRDVVRWTADHAGPQAAGLLLVHAGHAGDRTLGKVVACLAAAGVEQKGVERLQDHEGGIRGVLDACFAVSWVLPVEEAGSDRIALDMARVIGALGQGLTQPERAALRWQFEHETMLGAAGADVAWRTLLGRTLAGPLRSLHDGEGGKS